MGGRRAKYNVRIAKRICEHVALGATLKDALEREPMGPTIPTFWRWLDEYPEFRDMYDRARALQADLLSDSILAMAQEVLQKPKFAPAYKVASEILKWQAETKNPERYGKSVTVQHKKALDPATLKREIKQLEKELGLLGEDDGATIREMPIQDLSNG